ncbi:hypothetical protein H6503_03995 [Candidatus Woesearchaeota archaeon]|nr:hypothetical protein [Candidatus Woesearchaeota archaeon]
MLSINWVIVLVTTAVLYVLTIVALPFNTIYATIFLFTLIGFWSRLPGVGIVHPFFLLYNTDLVDLFALIITINLGPIPGIALIIFDNLWPRLCGIHPPWGAVITDTVSMTLVALMIPWIHSMTGDILMSMLIFTIIRAVLWQPLDLIFWPQSWANIYQQFILIMINVPTIFIINGFYAKIFGDFFDNLLQKGVVFSWPLFIFATIVIAVFYFSVFKKTQRVKSDNVVGRLLRKKIRNVLKNNSKQLKIVREDEFERIEDIKRMI